MASRFKFERIKKNFEQLKKTLPVEVGNTAQNFFRSSFEKQGFTDGSFKAWKPKKNKKAKAAILVGEKRGGTLRRAVGSSLKSTQWTNIGFKVPLPYAKIQNDGGTITRAPKSETFVRNRYKSGKRRGKFRKGTKAGKGYAFRKHSIVIPGRKYIGNSKFLFNKLDNLIHKRIRQLSK